MNVEQFQQLLAQIGAAPAAGSFSGFTSRFDGERHHEKVEEFITRLPLLLIETASTWWQGVKNEANSWSDVCKLIRHEFSPAKPPYQVYNDLCAEKQDTKTSVDEFVCKKRALLAQLPDGRHNEETQLDIVYGLLNLNIRKKVSLSDITSFRELLQKARLVEDLQTEEEIPKGNDEKVKQAYAKKNGCFFCGFRGHKLEDCRKRNKKLQAKTNEETTTSATSMLNKVETIKCYGCGKPGYFKSNCPTCSQKNIEAATNEINFYAINPVLTQEACVPTAPVTIYGKTGEAYFDTAARKSIAGSRLYEHLKQSNCKLCKQPATVTLVEGVPREEIIYSTTVTILLGGRSLLINFIVLPNAHDNRTLLGIDFLESAAIVLNLPQRSWCFADEPNNWMEFLPMRRISEDSQPASKRRKSVEMEQVETVSSATNKS
ncbi:hypothetical protein ILUMI_16475, partial [Ignelater luminosus]